MSRIGRMPIALTPDVKVTVRDGSISVQGPKGSLAHALPDGITAELDDASISIRRRNDSKQQRSLHGLVRALVANAVHGVKQGFAKELEIHGVGYRAEVKGRDVHFTLGYTHPVVFRIPEGIDVKIDRNRIRVAGHDRQLVGQVAADMRALRKPDVYKQKGIRYAGEILRKKAGKAGVK